MNFNGNDMTKDNAQIQNENFNARKFYKLTYVYFIIFRWYFLKITNTSIISVTGHQRIGTEGNRRKKLLS